MERPADERVGCADQFRHLDLVALREDLQPDGIECHRHEAGAEQAGEQPQSQPCDAGEGSEAARPERIGLNMRHPRERRQIGGKRVHRGPVRAEDEGIGQGVASQGGDELGKPLHRLELAQRILARHKAQLRHAGVGAQPLAERLGLDALRLGLQEERDLRLERQARGDRAQVLEQRIAARRKRQRDADDERAGKTRRFREPAQRLPERAPMLAQPGAHAMRPCSRRRMRLP